MPEEFVCEECAYTSIDDGNCPFCGSRMIKIDDDLDKDLADTEDERYDAKAIKVDDDDLDLDDVTVIKWDKNNINI